MTLATLTSRARRAVRVHVLQAKLINKQAEQIAVLTTLVDAQDEMMKRAAGLIDWLQLDGAKDKHGLISSWLISLERPEVDMREELAVAERNLAYEIAQREEHVLL